MIPQEPRTDDVSSEEGDAAARCAPSGRCALRWGVMLLAAAVIAAAVLIARRTRSETPSPGRPPVAPKTGARPADPQEGRLAALCDRPIGEAEAKVQVVAILPVSVGCKDHLGLYLADVANRFPSRVRVTLHDMQSEAGRRAMQQYERKCAVVLINGKSRFELDGGRKVRLEGADLGDAEEVRLALTQALRTAYAESAPALPAAPPAAKKP